MHWLNMRRAKFSAALFSGRLMFARIKDSHGQASTGSAVGENRSAFADNTQPPASRAPAETPRFDAKSPVYAQPACASSYQTRSRPGSGIKFRVMPEDAGFIERDAPLALQLRAIRCLSMVFMKNATLAHMLPTHTAIYSIARKFPDGWLGWMMPRRPGLSYTRFVQVRHPSSG